MKKKNIAGCQHTFWPHVIGEIVFITNKYRALGAIIILPVMLGILLIHIMNEPTGLSIAIVLFTVNL